MIFIQLILLGFYFTFILKQRDKNSKSVGSQDFQIKDCIRTLFFIPVFLFFVFSPYKTQTCTQDGEHFISVDALYK